MRPILILVGIALIGAVVAQAARADSSRVGSKAGPAARPGKCGLEAADTLLTRPIGHGPTPKPTAVLCGPYAGPHTSTMVVALAKPGCKGLNRNWVAFRAARQGWRRIWASSAREGSFRSIVPWRTPSTGRQIKETAPTKVGPKCGASGSRWRLWHWDRKGSKFVAGAWRAAKHGTGGGKERLVVSLSSQAVKAGEAVSYHVERFVGARDAGDVTNEVDYTLEYRGEQGEPLPPGSACPGCYENPHCQALCSPRIGSCDQTAHTCTFVSPGGWNLFALNPKSHVNGEGSVTVKRKANLSIAPAQVPVGIFGLTEEQRFEASGQGGEPLTWEAESLELSEFWEPFVPWGETFQETDTAYAAPGDFSGTVDPTTGTMKLTTFPGTRKIIVRAWDRSGDSGEETFSYTAEAPPCATVCLYAGPNGELSLAWQSCGGCAETSSTGHDYDVSAIIDGTPSSYSVALSSVKEPFSSGQLWETFSPSQPFGQSAGDIIQLKVSGERIVPRAGEPGFYEQVLTPVGTSNAVEVK